MRAIAVALFATLCQNAAAQAPITFPIGDAATAPAGKWVVEDTESKRFLGEDVVGPTFIKGDRLQVLYEEGDQVRVRKGNDYGWVAASALTDEAPAPPPTTLDLSNPAAPVQIQLGSDDAAPDAGAGAGAPDAGAGVTD